LFIKKTSKRAGSKTYVNHLLVESVATPKGPRHRVLCSLGPLSPAPQDHWLALAHRIETALSGQQSIESDASVDAIVEKIEKTETRGSKPAALTDCQPADSDLVAVHTNRISVEQAREAGPVHVAHQMWKRLGLDDVLAKAGLSRRARQLTELMTINRLVAPLSEYAMPDWIRRTAGARRSQREYPRGRAREVSRTAVCGKTARTVGRGGPVGQPGEDTQAPSTERDGNSYGLATVKFDRALLYT
jgi:hypothetical protein